MNPEVKKNRISLPPSCYSVRSDNQEDERLQEGEACYEENPPRVNPEASE